jgi:hypothetical protein
MSIIPSQLTVIYFGGFQQRRLPDGDHNAFSRWLCWLYNRQPVPTTVVINLRKSAESLQNRWCRFQAMNGRLLTDSVYLHIMAYSIGCHLAVKLASDRDLVDKVKELWLLAPDPKFCPNVLDNDDSAYQQAQVFWETAGRPGDELSARLALISAGRIHVVSSKRDPLTLWNGNAEIMLSRHTQGDTIDRQIVEDAQVKTDWGNLVFDPCDARHDFWVHEQLFTKWQKA